MQVSIAWISGRVTFVGTACVGSQRILLYTLYTTTYPTPNHRNSDNPQTASRSTDPICPSPGATTTSAPDLVVVVPFTVPDGFVVFKADLTE